VARRKGRAKRTSDAPHDRSDKGQERTFKNSTLNIAGQLPDQFKGLSIASEGLRFPESGELPGGIVLAIVPTTQTRRNQNAPNGCLKIKSGSGRL